MPGASYLDSMGGATWTRKGSEISEEARVEAKRTLMAVSGLKITEDQAVLEQALQPRLWKV